MICQLNLTGRSPTLMWAPSVMWITVRRP